MKMYRQGDVLLVAVDEIPAKAKKLKSKKGRVILAYGEVTGHHHSLAADTAMEFQTDTERYVEVSAEEMKQAVALLEHQEHGPIAVPDGKYKIVIQREYSPEEIRNVRD